MTIGTRHQAQANRLQAGETGAFVQKWRDMGVSFELQMLRLPDGRGYDRRPDYSGTWVHSGQMGSVQDWIDARERKGKL